MSETNGHVTKQDLKEALNGVEERIAALIAGELGSLHTQIQQTEERITARLGAKIEELHTRLDNHAGMLQSGSRQITRFFRFAERSSKHWQALAKRVDAIEKRLEEGNGGKTR
jgi:ABC-type transporter Mla subunit MlaD